MDSAYINVLFKPVSIFCCGKPAPGMEMWSMLLAALSVQMLSTADRVSLVSKEKPGGIPLASRATWSGQTANSTQQKPSSWRMQTEYLWQGGVVLLVWC